MFYVILGVIFLAIAFFGRRFIFPKQIGGWTVPGSATFGLQLLAGFIALICFLDTSIVSVPADEVGIVRRIYGISNMPDGHIIATNGETGYQAEIISPGTWRVSLFFNIFNSIEHMPMVQVPQGFYGRIVARDGVPLAEGQIMADAWADAEFSKMLDAQYFMTHGGRRSLQLSVLKPGAYPMNLKLFQVKVGREPNGKDVKAGTDLIYDETGFHEEETPLNTSITRVPAGFVGVVRSSVQAIDAKCAVEKVKVDASSVQGSASVTNEPLSADLVPQNCKGIWNYALPPNDYYLNRDAYEVTLVDTRVQTLEFKGGFQRRWIDLTVNQKGDFEQTPRKETIPVPADAADDAVNTKVEGWEIPQELRVVLQISPKNAPIIVAAVGGLKEVETRITVPSVRAHVRNVFGGEVEVTEQEMLPPAPLVADGKAVLGSDGKPVMGEPQPKTDPNGNAVTHRIKRPTKVLDTVTQRTALEDEILVRVAADGARAGIDVKEIRLGESVIPPELLLARQRQQLATQLRLAFVTEQQAQTQRQEVERARATADQQKDLVTAQIGVETANLGRQRRTAEGEAEQKYLEAVAQGQKAQANVLGADKVFIGNLVTAVTKALTDHPEIIANQRWPLFIGGSAIENVAGMLSQSGLVQAQQAR